jgi:hypothetical protein
MKNLRETDFAERRKAAAEAKKQLLDKLSPSIKADSPELQAKLAEKAAIAAAREARRIERERAKKEEAERKLAEETARAAAEAAERETREREEAERAIAEAAERKAERDRRYAARKNRQR